MKKQKNLNAKKSQSIIPTADILSVITGMMVIGALAIAPAVQAETSTKNKELEKNTPSTTGTQRSAGTSGLEAPQSSTKSPEAEKMAPDTAGTRNSEGNSGNIAPQTSTKNREAEERAKGTSTEGRHESRASLSDQEFLIKASQSGLTEVKLGELAQKKGSRDDVRDFGKMMVKDHTRINNDVKNVASKNNVDLPRELEAKHQQKVDDLSKLSGAAFDKAYLDAMATAHTKDLALFKAQRASTNDPALKESLDKAIPIVESHISHLNQVKP